MKDIISEQSWPPSVAPSSKSIAIIFVLAAAGIMSSLVLRYENSITKGVASASETIIVTIIQCVWYKDVLSYSEITGVFLVTVGTVLYSLPCRTSLSASHRQVTMKCSLKQLFVYGFVLTCILLMLIDLAVVGRGTIALEYDDSHSVLLTNIEAKVSDICRSLYASPNKTIF